MSYSVQHPKKKHILIKSFSQLQKLITAIDILKNDSEINSQLSILSMFTNEQSFKNKKDQIQFEKQLKEYWKKVLGSAIEFGIFKNPEIGTVYIIGSLTSLFMHEINGKALGGISVGLNGILRGLGAGKTNADTFIEMLHNGNYLLIIRGFDDDLHHLKTALEEV
ncbi:hypothetical protein FF125_09100 [Aureibaculum algae]|uniref:Uncharacterized protein n=1 Tax=Aureibaculum algae TaxID=2584122 RepID=A0A5B7TQM2_9FLAO|nr:hypothetical protein [Aureibaculum algae]QCX38580.1 hypothetical protein FF125_09100 [Aureibaculum algae]